MPAPRPHAPRTLSLTPAHVALIHRPVEEGPPLPGFRKMEDPELGHWADRMLADDPDPAGPLRLFAYGSLIWKPEVAHVAEEEGLLHGWHRSFCLSMPRYRGTPEFPGLMMALDRGGACRGVILTVEPGDKRAQLAKLFAREMPYWPTGNLPLWVRLRTATGEATALAFIANRTSPRYAGRLPAETVADVLAQACGHGGTGAEYLMQTAAHLEARGIRDSLLWRLQEMVAARIDAAKTTVRP